MKALLCNPAFFGIEYSINPWMNPSNDANRATAIAQWGYLRDKLEDLGVDLHYMEPQNGLPDMVFTANAGVVAGDKFYPSRFRHPERQGEEGYFINWFEKNGYEIHDIIVESDDDLFCEGAGDILEAHGVYWNGHGFRSDPAPGFRIYKESFKDHFLANLKLTCPDFYHLDTCLCPLKRGVVIANLHAFDEESAGLINYLSDTVIQPPETECRNFACNSVVLDDDVIMPDGCPATAREVEKHGFKVHHVPMSEFIKSGGACKCLTLFI
tara:strand:- start:5686 stop:6489 length:804 start_codon:yes stop_codon:yes gene_type:complete